MPLPPTPRVAWGPGFAHSWVFPGPVDTPVATTIPRGRHAEAESGARDWWGTRDDHELTLMVRFVPGADQAGVTGYSTPGTGVREALAWMWKNPFRFHPDHDDAGFHLCHLLEWPQAEREGGMFFRFALKLRDAEGVAFTEY